MRKKAIYLILIFLLVQFVISVNIFPKESRTITVAMCRPSPGQIENIVTLRNSGMINAERIKLLCVYHEDELTDYKASFSYVRNNKIKWVEFVKISGRVEIKDLFGKNIWTSQFHSVFRNSDGIIFTGGMDIPPAIYGEENSLLTRATTPVRTFYETSFLFHLIGSSRNRSFTPFLEERKNYSVLGICLGTQTMNVAAGGSLIQDIPSEVYGMKSVEQVLKAGRDKIHSSLYMKLLYPEKRDLISPAFHRIRYTENSVILKRFFQKGSALPLVLSSHHQAIDKVGYGLFVAARSMDGKIVEAVEHRKYKNVLGVQFHPEYRLMYGGVRLFTNDPSGGEFFTLKDFVKSNPVMSSFHRELWKWFTTSLKRE